MICEGRGLPGPPPLASVNIYCLGKRESGPGGSGSPPGSNWLSGETLTALLDSSYGFAPQAQGSVQPSTSQAKDAPKEDSVPAQGTKSTQVCMERDAQSPHPCWCAFVDTCVSSHRPQNLPVSHGPFTPAHLHLSFHYGPNAPKNPRISWLGSATGNPTRQPEVQHFTLWVRRVIFGQRH